MVSLQDVIGRTQRQSGRSQARAGTGAGGEDGSTDGDQVSPTMVDLMLIDHRRGGIAPHTKGSLMVGLRPTPVTQENFLDR